MVRHFINPSTLQIFLKNKKIPTAAAHRGQKQILPWDEVLAQHHANAPR
jgi:hypothetical protein